MEPGWGRAVTTITRLNSRDEGRPLDNVRFHSAVVLTETVLYENADRDVSESIKDETIQVGWRSLALMETI